MESSKRPLKRLPQVTFWELQRHNITVRNPLAWDKLPSDKPIERDILDVGELCLHRAGEGLMPLFDRDDILVNQDGMEERTMRVDRTQRSRSSSSSSSDNSSESSDSVRAKARFPKPLRFNCEKGSAGESSKERRSTERNPDQPKRKRRSKSPYGYPSPGAARKSPPPPSRPRPPVHSRLGKSPLRRSMSPPPPPPPRAADRRRRSPPPARPRSREPARRSRSPDRKPRRDSPRRSRTPPPRRSRTPPRRSDRRYRDYDKSRRSPPHHRRYSPSREETDVERFYPGGVPAQVPPIDYAHLAHVITQMTYPRQPFIPPHVVPPQPPDFYAPPYGIPAVPLAPPPRPRFPARPPLVYNNRAIKIYKPSSEATAVTTTTTSTATPSEAAAAASGTPSVSSTGEKAG